MSVTTAPLGVPAPLPVGRAPTRVARAAALAAVVALVATVVAGIVQGAAGGTSVAAGRLASGTLEARVDDTWRPVEIGAVIPVEVDLRSPEGAVVGLGGGAVELAAGATGTRRGDVLDLGAGSALVVDDAFVELAAGTATVTGRGAWRVDAALPGRVAVYDGSASLVDGVGRDEVVARGQQLAVRSGRATGSVVPLRYVADDPFDARLLADALSVDAFLDATARALELDYGVAPQTAAFYTDFDTLDGEVVGLLRPLGFAEQEDRFGPPAAVLMAAVVTESLVQAAGLTPVAAATEVDAARRAGAEYGLVTHLRDVSPSTVRAAAGRALTQRQQLVAAGTAAPVIDAPPPAGTAVAAPPATPDTAPGSPDDGVDPDVQPSPPGPADPDPVTPPGPDPTPDPTPEPEPDDPGTTSGVVDDVEEVTGPLEGVVGEDVAEVVDDTTELLDDVLDGTLPGLVGPAPGPTEDAGVVEELVDGLGGLLAP